MLYDVIVMISDIITLSCSYNTKYHFSHLLKGLRSGCPPHGGIRSGCIRYNIYHMVHNTVDASEITLFICKPIIMYILCMYDSMVGVL